MTLVGIGEEFLRKTLFVRKSGKLSEKFFSDRCNRYLLGTACIKFAAENDVAVSLGACQMNAKKKDVSRQQGA